MTEKEKEALEKELKYLEKLRKLEKGVNPRKGGYLAGAKALLGVFKDGKYIYDNLTQDPKGVLDYQEYLKAKEFVFKHYNGNESVLFKFKYQANDRMLDGKEIIDAEAYPGDLSDVSKLPTKPDLDQDSGIYFELVPGGKPVYSNPEDTSPEAMKLRKDEAILIDKLQKGLIKKVIQDKTIKSKVELLDELNTNLDHYLDQLSLDQIPAEFHAVPADLIKNRLKRTLEEEEEQVDDSSNAIDDNTNPQPQPTSDPTTKPDPTTDPTTKPINSNPPVTPSPIEPNQNVSTESYKQMSASANEDSEYKMLIDEINANTKFIFDYAISQLSTTIDYKQFCNPSPSLFKYSINIDVLRGFTNSTDKAYISLNPFCKSFYALLKASPMLNDFFSDAVENGYNEDDIYDIMQLFGVFKRKEHMLYVGDIVYISNAMTADGGDWGIIIQTKDNIIQELLILGEKDSTGKIKKNVVNSLIKVWSPIPSKMLDDNCLFGKFWGPGMSKLKQIISNRRIMSFNLAKHIFEKTKYSQINDSSEIWEMLGSEIRLISEKVPGIPGAIVINEFGRIGIVLRDKMIMAENPGSTYSYKVDWYEFVPKYIWYPHL